MASPNTHLFCIHSTPPNPYPKASGVGLHQDCLPVYQELKLGHKHKYIIYNLSQDLTQITVEKKDSDSEYDNFLTNLPENQCRWAVYDFEYKVDGAPRNKLVFFSW
jgi:cofilin